MKSDEPSTRWAIVARTLAERLVKPRIRRVSNHGGTRRAQHGLIVDGFLAQSLAEVGAVWAIRDAISEFASVCGPGVDSQIGLPAAGMDRFARACREMLSRQAPDAKNFIFGPIGDGNPHIRVATPTGSDASKPHIETCIHQLARSFAGSISTGHGIGLTKKPRLDQARSPGKIATMRLLKRTLDRKGLFNPGKVIESIGIAPTGSPGVSTGPLAAN